ncbi:putative ribonuclease H-like domain-containing protein, partial [Tanacetum coccineum]
MARGPLEQNGSTRTRKIRKMDMKSAFLYGKIEEEVYVCQPLGFEDPEFPNKVYKRGQIDKTLFIKKVKGDILLVQVYVDDIIFGSTKKVLCTEFEKLMQKKFQMSSMASTPMETHKPLLKDADGEDVDEHLYRSMIGSLMYLTSSRPDIIFSVCACVRYQVNPKASHLHAVKRIFRYLKGQPKLSLWYPKDSPFDLVAYTDNDYAGTSLDRKSTTGALVDKKKVIITETSVRSDLQLEDAEGTECLPNDVTFKQLTLMGANTTAWNEFSSTMASAIICLVTNQKFNFSKYIFDCMVKNLEGGVKFLMYP